MTKDGPYPVVVGIDGSDVALDAAQWAVGEAMARDVPLRMINTANTSRTKSDWVIEGPEAVYGEAALRTAAAAVAATGEPVKLETEVLWGPPANALIAESRHAAMICLGTVGIGAVARAVLGSVAVAVAERAHCPVAVLRPRSGAHTVAENWVAVGLEDRPESDVAVKMALDEARIRHATVVAVGLGCNAFGVTTEQRTQQLVERWRAQYPDLTIDVFEATGGLAEFLADNRDELSRRYATTVAAHVLPLAVLASHDVADMKRIVGPHDDVLHRHAQCSVLVAR